MGKESVTFPFRTEKKEQINLRMLKAILPTECRVNKTSPKAKATACRVESKKKQGRR